MSNSPLLWFGLKAKLLRNALQFNESITVYSGSADPASVATAGNTGDVYISTNGGFYVKQDAGTTTNWIDLTIGGTIPWGSITGTLSSQSDLQSALNLKATLLSPTFTGTVSGITATMVGLSNVDNTSDASKPVSTATQTALNLKANLASPTFTGTVSGITSTMVGLGNVDNTSDVTKNTAVVTLTNKTLTAPVINSPTGIVKADVGLGNVDNTSDANKPVSTTTQTALNLKAPIASPTFTGTVSGITKTMVGLSNVDNTSDATKNAAAVILTNKTLTAPIISSISNTGTLTLPTSTDTLVGKATTDTLTNKTLTSPVINTPTGIVKGDVGLGNVPNIDSTKEGPGISLDGGPTAITTGAKGSITIPYSCTINSVTLIASPSGSIVIDIKKSTYSGFPSTTSICASAKPTISSAQKSTDSTLTGWTTTITSGDVLEYNVDSCTSIIKCTLILGVTKT